MTYPAPPLLTAPRGHGYELKRYQGGRPGLRPADREESMAKFRIAVIEGDGIGREVVPAARQVLEAAGRRHGFEFA